MTKEEAVRYLGITGTIDYAIPEDFNSKMRAFVDFPPAHYVWSYDNSIFGYPRPLTETGRIALQNYNGHYGTGYSTMVNVLQI